MAFPENLTNAIDGVTEIVADHLNNLERKVGVDNSTDITSLDYLLKNSSSSNPGHRHTLAHGATDVTASAAELNLLDLSGLTVGQVLRATGATSAAWDSIQENDLPDLSTYVKLGGRSGGQTIYGGTGTGETLVLTSTAHVTKGAISLENLLYVSDGNVRIGATSVGTGAAKVLAIGLGTAPTTSPTDTVQLYVANRGGIDGKAGLLVLAEDGSLSVFSDRVLLAGTASTNIDAKAVLEGTGQVVVRMTSTDDSTSTLAGHTINANNNSVWFYAHGPSRTASRCGITLGGWCEINARNTGNRGILIATDQAYPIVFGTDNTERMRILSSGYVGIGTTSPSTLFHVAGGNSTFGGHILTSGQGVYDIGSSSYRFGTLYSNKINISFVCIGGDNIVGASGDKVLAFLNGTAPTTAPTDVCQLWTEDVNGGDGKASLHMMAESGTNKLVVVGTIIKTSTGDPTQVHEGLMVINTADKAVKIYAGGAWRTLTTWS